MALYLDSLYILNSVARSSELNLASFSLPHSETFGLCATVISTAFPRLAQSPEPEGKTAGPSLANRGRLLLVLIQHKNKHDHKTRWHQGVSSVF